MNLVEFIFVFGFAIPGVLWGGYMAGRCDARRERDS